MKYMHKMESISTSCEAQSVLKRHQHIQSSSAGHGSKVPSLFCNTNAVSHFKSIMGKYQTFMMAQEDTELFKGSSSSAEKHARERSG